MNFDRHHQKKRSVIRRSFDLWMAVFYLIINQAPLNHIAPMLFKRLRARVGDLSLDVLAFDKSFVKIEKRIR